MVSFTSRESWIQFGGLFTYTGTNGGTGASVLNIEAKGAPCTPDCGGTGGYVRMDYFTNVANFLNPV
jgi:hypothetical protein